MASYTIQHGERAGTIISIRDSITRGMRKQIQSTLLNSVHIKNDGEPDLEHISALDLDRSHELFVSLMTGMSTQELDALDERDYKAILEAVNEVGAFSPSEPPADPR